MKLFKRHKPISSKFTYMTDPTTSIGKFIYINYSGTQWVVADEKLPYFSDFIPYIIGKIASVEEYPTYYDVAVIFNHLGESQSLNTSLLKGFLDGFHSL